MYIDDRSRTRPMGCNLAQLRVTLGLLLTLSLPILARPRPADSLDEKIQVIQHFLQEGDTQMARTTLIRVMKEHPHEPGLYNLMGVVEAQDGNYQKAEANFK